MNRIFAALAMMAMLCLPSVASAQSYTYTVDGIPIAPTITAKVADAPSMNIAVMAFRSAWQQDTTLGFYAAKDNSSIVANYAVQVMARYLTANKAGSGGSTCDLMGARQAGYADAKARAIAAANGL